MPSFDDIKSLVGTKMNRMIALNPILKEWVGDGDSVERKQVGKSVLNLKGTMTERAALMVTSGLNVHDEIDRSNLSIIEQYESRQQFFPVKKRWVFSNPSSPGIGIDAYWAKSDMKEWHISCHACGERQKLKFPESINFDGGFYQCVKCRADIGEQREASDHAALAADDDLRRSPVDVAQLKGNHLTCA